MKIKLIFTIIFAFFISLAVCSAQNAKPRNAIKMSGIKNVRDLGGLQIGNKVICDKLLLCSANISNATNGDKSILERRYKVAKIIDFRTSFEVDYEKDIEIDKCEKVWLPCLEGIVTNFTSDVKIMETTSGVGETNRIANAILEHIDNPKLKEIADSLYFKIVFDKQCQRQFSKFLVEITDMPANRAVLWHCTQGKDRTGWASTFVLAALGADRKTLISEFEQTNIAYKPLLDVILAKAKEKGCTEEQIETIYTLVGVSTKKFEETLDLIDEKYGSMDEYLTDALVFNSISRDILKSFYLR